MARKQADDTVTATATAEPASAATPRLSVQLDDKGSIAWDRMRPATRDQLKKALSDPSVAQQLGMASSDSITGTVEGFDPSICGVLYDSLSTLMIGLARARGYTEQQANVLRFDTTEKQALIEPTARVMNKYAGSLGKYQDEIMLGVVLSTVISGKLAQLRKSAQVIHMHRTDAAPETPAEQPQSVS